MSSVSHLSPERTRSLLQLARAFLVAVRNWALYPPQHPAVSATVDRLCDALKQSSFGTAFTIGITPETLLVDGAPANSHEQAIAEAAALLHDRDLMTITFLGEVPREAVQALLSVISLDAASLRCRGGSAHVWTTEGHPSILLEQLDYQKVLARTESEVTEAAQRDDIWRSIVTSLTAGHKVVLDELEQQRLLAIAASPADIGDLAREVMAPKRTHDGSPMITSQAVTVLAAFRRLADIVSVMAPERLPQLLGNLAISTLHLDPHVAIELMQTEEGTSGVPLLRGIADALDDAQVAQLLATVLELDGQVSDRLATVFSTIAPDEERKRSVLALTHNLLSGTNFGKSSTFQTLWASIEELLVSYNDKPFVSESYRATLDGVGRRADAMADGGLPPDLPEWMESVSPRSVRELSVTLLIDLFTLERDEARAAGIAQDMATLAEELLISGAYDDGRLVVKALAARTGDDSAIASDPCRQTLARLGESTAMREAAALVGDLDKRDWHTLGEVLATIGTTCVEALRSLVVSERETLGSQRAGELIVGFGAAAVGRLASLLTDSRWYAQRNAVRLLGRIGSPEAVPLLQPLLRNSDPRVAREVVSALCAIDDPSAGWAVETVLRTATGELRRAVIDALIADRDPRVLPILVRILDESRPFGQDHEVVLETLAAMEIVGADEAVPAILRLIGHRRRFFGRRKSRALKDRGIRALIRIGSPSARTALENARRTGDRMLRTMVAQRTRGTARS